MSTTTFRNATRTAVFTPTSDPWFPLQIAIIAMLLSILLSLSAVELVQGTDYEARYIHALDANDLWVNYPSVASAVTHAEDVCGALNGGSAPRGTLADKIGVEFYCPRFAGDFVIATTD